MIQISFLLIVSALAQNKLAQNKCPDFKNFCHDLKVVGGTDDNEFWSENCDEMVSHDFHSRDSLKEYPDGCTASDKWGPKPIQYPLVKILKSCNKVKWQHKRILAVIDKIVKMKLNYCHHHSPMWTPEEADRKTTGNTTGGDTDQGGKCSEEGLKHLKGAAGFRGIDCTHFTSYVYNYGFGCYQVTLTGDQACGPNAPGGILPFTVDEQDKFLPGDLLYIAKKGSAHPLQISHGILWTGYKMSQKGEFSEEKLIENMPENQKKAVIEYIEARKAANKPVYVIADSHGAGPNYRPFAGWYTNSFSHARRLIKTDKNEVLQKTSEFLIFAKNKCENSKPKKGLKVPKSTESTATKTKAKASSGQKPLVSIY